MCQVNERVLVGKPNGTIDEHAREEDTRRHSLQNGGKPSGEERRYEELSDCISHL